MKNSLAFLGQLPLLVILIAIMVAIVSFTFFSAFVRPNPSANAASTPVGNLSSTPTNAPLATVVSALTPPPKVSPTETPTLILTPRSVFSATPSPTTLAVVASPTRQIITGPTPSAWRAENIGINVERPLDPTANVIALGVSPDGTKILFRKTSVLYRFARFSDGTGSFGQLGDVWVMQISDSSNQHKLADIANTWAWSPDGKSVAISSPAQTEGIHGYISIMDLGNFQSRKVTSNTLVDSSLYWLPRDEVAFTRDSSIYTIRSDGSAEHKVNSISITPPGQANSGAGFFGISPDGKKISYASSAGTPLFIANLDGSAAVKITDGNAALPTWSPDSTKLTFVNFNAYAGTGFDSNISIVNADGSGNRQVLSSTRDEENIFPAWAPNGNVLAFVKRPVIPFDPRSGNPQPPVVYSVWLVNDDGTGAHDLIDNVARLNVHWLPTGTQIVFSRPIMVNVDNTPATVKSVIADLVAH